MANPSWPASLPQSWPLGVTEMVHDGRVRTEMDAGPAKLRRRFTTTWSRYKIPDGKFLFTGTQVGTFTDWYEGSPAGDSPNQIGMGTSLFTWTNPRGASETLTLRFVSRPTFKAIIPDSSIVLQTFAMQGFLVETVP